MSGLLLAPAAIRRVMSPPVLDEKPAELGGDSIVHRLELLVRVVQLEPESLERGMTHYCPL